MIAFRRWSYLFLLAAVLWPCVGAAQPQSWSDPIDRRAARIEPQVIGWRRAIHERPELSNREYRTAAMVATHLRSLGIAVETGVAKTGVVGVLRGARPGPVIGLRADMDALPVKEQTGLPFASTDSAWYGGERVPVMHACGHDAHVAMLMGAAEVLASMRERLPGTVKFLFQPAEEGTPPGERGGADLMVDEGALDDPNVDAVFGLHVDSKLELGTIEYRPGPFLAAADGFRITIYGKQTHGATPGAGLSPIAIGARIVTRLRSAARPPGNASERIVVSVGTFEAGTRTNIIPGTATLSGTVRSLDSEQRNRVHRRIRRVAQSTAQRMGGTADVTIRRGYPVTRNDVGLTAALRPGLRRAADSLVRGEPVMGAEDFSYFAREVPGLYVFVGGRSPSVPPAAAPSHHTPTFRIDERSLRYGVRAYAQVAATYLTKEGERRERSAPDATRRTRR